VQTRLTRRRILALREHHRKLIANPLGRAAGNGHHVFEYLFEHPIVSINEIADLLGVTYAAASNLVGRLIVVGVLAEITGQTRNRRFRYDPYTELFADQ
jgi:DNA-binding MarR family transcriptional regulator